MTLGYRTLEQKPYDSHYLYVDTIVDRPLKAVWPHVLNIGSWMSAHRLETLDGESGKVGHFERVYPRGLGAETGLPHHHLYGVGEIIPYKLIVLEVLAEQGGSYGDSREWMSFDSIQLADLGGRTQVAFLLVDVHPGKGDAAFHERQRKKLEGGRTLLEQYFENLKKLVGHGG